MLAFASSLDSSLDLLVARDHETLSSPVQDSSKVFRLSPSSNASTRGSPYERKVYHAQGNSDSRIPHGDLISSSGSYLEARNRGEWPVQEAHHEWIGDREQADANRSKMQQPTPMSKARTRATTMVIPLRDDSESNNTPSKSKRTRKSTPRRPPTPKPKTRKRVLEEIENEETVRHATPKRPKHKANSDTELSVHQSIEGDVAPVLHLDDLLEAAMTAGDGYISNSNDAVSQLDPEPVKAPAVVDRSGRRNASRSPFRFKRPGQETILRNAADPISSHSKATRRILMSDFAEPRAEYDSIIEGEDFTMISLSTVPSARQHLDSRRDIAPTTSSVSQRRATGSLTPRRQPRSAKASPSTHLRAGTFRSPVKDQSVPNARNEEDSLQLTPRIRPQASVDRHALNQNDSPLISNDGDDNPEDDDRQYSKMDDTNVLAAEEYVQEDLPLDSASRRQERHSALPGTSNSNNSDPDNHFDSDRAASPVQKLPSQKAVWRDSSIDEPPEYLPEVEDFDENKSVEENGNPTVDDSHDDYSRINATRRPEQRILPDSRSTQQHIAMEEKTGDLDQSSMLRLPQNGPAPSRIFSSPDLPDIPLLREKPVKQSPKPAVEVPSHSRAVRAGKALQDVVQPVGKPSADRNKHLSLSNSPREVQEKLFSGFSVAARRELRAGLRLGEELAKRQSSMIDITMHSAPSPVPNQHQDIRENDAQAGSARKETNKATNGVRYPDLSDQPAIQYPTPDTSSNETNQRQVTTKPLANAGRETVYTAAAADPNRSSQIRELNVTETAVPEEPAADDLNPPDYDADEYQDDGFASDDDFEPENQPAAHEETDIWQLEAKAMTPPAQNIHSQQENDSRHIDVSQIDGTSEYPRNHRLQPSFEQEDGDVENQSELSEFDNEHIIASSRIQTPKKRSELRISSETVSSPNVNDAHGGEDFTNFTRDLLQAANRQPQRTIASRIDKPEPSVQTPTIKVSKQRGSRYADLFTTESLLQTSAVSMRTQKSPARRPLSFRPPNRKESWLFDPQRLRKPPSPLKNAGLLTPRPNLAFPTANPEQSLEDLSEVEETASVSETAPEKTSNLVQRTQSTPDPDPAASSPLSIFVAAAQKRQAPTFPQGPSKAPQKQATSQTGQFGKSKPVAAAPSVRSTVRTENQRPAPRPNTKQRDSSRPGSSTQITGTDTAQSSFISNPSTNTSYNEDETQTSWLSLLTSVATPFIASTKVVSKLASTAFRSSQQQTYYPVSIRENTGPAILTKHHPFNDAHWTALRSLYTTALKRPDKFKLNLQSIYAEYLGLEIESLGWKRQLQEWELAVVAQFLRLVREKGVEQDPSQSPIDIEAVIKRVFSLWVGMVTRGELELTDGRAGAWDRRFVSRRNEVLRKQQEWLLTHS